MTWFEENISIPFPLSNGKFARLYVPPKMSINDAKRLKRMINALYINGQHPRSVETLGVSGNGDNPSIAEESK